VNAIKAIVKDRRIALDVPDDWPEGTEVVIEPLTQSIGLREEDWPATPEAIADWMAWYESLEPLIFTPEEESELAAWRQKIKEYTIANMDRSIEGLWK
jgi:hypothetical protein